ncbi:MAG: hypothetical protein JW888_17045 [Pirellulales bacterium]|nr:hypothetical protein [Pirellulales bacterium]
MEYARRTWSLYMIVLGLTVVAPVSSLGNNATAIEPTVEANGWPNDGYTDSGSYARPFEAYEYDYDYPEALTAWSKSEDKRTVALADGQDYPFPTNCTIDKQSGPIDTILHDELVDTANPAGDNSWMSVPTVIGDSTREALEAGLPRAGLRSLAERICMYFGRWYEESRDLGQLTPSSCQEVQLVEEEVYGYVDDEYGSSAAFDVALPESPPEFPFDQTAPLPEASTSNDTETCVEVLISWISNELLGTLDWSALRFSASRLETQSCWLNDEVETFAEAVIEMKRQIDDCLGGSFLTFAHEVPCAAVVLAVHGLARHGMSRAPAQTFVLRQTGEPNVDASLEESAKVTLDVPDDNVAPHAKTNDQASQAANAASFIHDPFWGVATSVATRAFRHASGRMAGTSTKIE